MTRLDRLDYVEGSRLLARDLGDTARHEAQWQGLHVSQAHDTWGVAAGLGLTLTPNGRSVVVGAGAAFDCKGQAISLPSPVELSEPTEDVPGIVTPPFDVVLGKNGPRWEATGFGPAQPGFGKRVRIGTDIPLGRYIRLPWGQLTGPNMGFRKTARPMTRPRIGVGLVTASALTWIAVNGTISAAIDTSASNFSSTPRYVGWIASRPDMGDLIGPFLSLSAFYPDHFTVRMLAISRFGDSAVGVQLSLLSRAAAMRIAWVGVESNAGGIA